MVYNRSYYPTGLITPRYYILQIRKLAASHSVQADHNELTIKEKMGFSEIINLEKFTLLRFRIFKVACVLPGGVFIPFRAHDLSESDSD